MSNDTPSTGAMTERSFFADLPKYFLHGIIYAIVTAVAGTIVGSIGGVFSMILVPITLAAGQLVGWILAIVLLILLLAFSLLVIGIINTYLSVTFWKVSSPMNWKSLIGHGGVLVLLLFLFGLPALLLDFLLIGLDPFILILILVPRVVIYSIIYGYTGRFVALGFGDVRVAIDVIKVPAGLLSTCPNCGVETLCKMSKDEEAKVISCTNCGLPFEVLRPD